MIGGFCVAQSLRKDKVILFFLNSLSSCFFPYISGILSPTDCCISLSIQSNSSLLIVSLHSLKLAFVLDSVPAFYSRLRKWIEMASLPVAARDMISHSERYFQISRTIFERYEQMFLAIFHDPLDPEASKPGLVEKMITLRRKQYVMFLQTGVVCVVSLFVWMQESSSQFQNCPAY